MHEDVKNVQLKLLIKLDEVCKRHNLKYYLAYGTCIGAVRHKGFIPWDSDIDVLMPITDAKKLPQFQSEFGSNYFVQCKETDPGFRYITYKLRDSNTTCIWKEYRNDRFNQGISIDIYPYYNCPQSRWELQLNIWRSFIYRILVAGRGPLNHSKIAKIIGDTIVFFYKDESRRKAMIQKLERKLMDVPEGKELLDYFGLDITLFSAITYNREWFGQPQKMEFEGLLFDGPADPDKYLTKRYGDYMVIPPVEKQKDPFDKPGVIIDTNKSYLEYYKEMDNK